MMFHRRVFVPEVEGELQVAEEEVVELGVHVQHLQKLLPLDGVQVAVAQCPHVRVGLPRLGAQMDHLAEDVVFPWWRRNTVVSESHGEN